MNIYFIYLWLYHNILLQEYTVAVSYYHTACEDLPTLKYCPKFNDTRWRLRASCKDCHGNLKYHCCKDYDSPKLDCPQDDVYCKDEIYVEGCAEEIFCKKGEEPVLSFIKNQKRTDQPEVFCELCYNNNRYNDFINSSSATFSECPHKKQNICTQKTRKIECSKPSVTSERICRCDVENGYYPYSHPDDHPDDGCSKTLYDCNTGRCLQNEKMLLNYTCDCKEGFQRINGSTDCVSNHTTSSLSPTSTRTMNTTADVRSSSETSKQQTTAAFGTSSTAPAQSKKESNEKTGDDKMVVVISTCLLSFLIGVCVTIVGWKVYSKCKKTVLSTRIPRRDANTNIERTQQETSFILHDQSMDNDESDTNENIEGVNSPLTQKSQSSVSTLRLSKYSKGSQNTFTSTQETIHLPLSRYHETNSLDRRPHPKTDDSNKPKVRQMCLKIDEDFVKAVLQKCNLKMIENLDPDHVLDVFNSEDLMSPSTIKDIKEIEKPSDKIREILDRIRKNYILYDPFKRSLKYSKQDSCYKLLLSVEWIVACARPKETSLKADLLENESELEDNTSHLQRRRHTFSTSSTGFELKLDCTGSNDEEKHSNNDFEKVESDVDNVWEFNDHDHKPEDNDPKNGSSANLNVLYLQFNTWQRCIYKDLNCSTHYHQENTIIISSITEEQEETNGKMAGDEYPQKRQTTV